MKKGRVLSERKDNFHVDFHTIHCIVLNRIVLYIVATRYYSTNDRYWVALPWGEVYQADVHGCKDPVVKIYFATNSIFFFSKHCKNRECFRMSQFIVSWSCHSEWFNFPGWEYQNNCHCSHRLLVKLILFFCLCLSLFAENHIFLMFSLFKHFMGL